MFIAFDLIIKQTKKSRLGRYIRLYRNIFPKMSFNYMTSLWDLNYLRPSQAINISSLRDCNDIRIRK